MTNRKNITKVTVEAWKSQVAKLTTLPEYRNGERISWEAIYQKLKRSAAFKGLTKAQVKAKMKRWYEGNPALVEEIRKQDNTSAKKSATPKSKDAMVKAVATAAREAIDDEEKNIDKYAENAEIRVTEKGTNKDGNFTKTIDVMLDPDAPIDDDRFILKLMGFNPERFSLVSVKIAESNWQAQRSGGEIVTLVSKRFSAVVKPLIDDINLEVFRKVYTEELADMGFAPVPKLKVDENADTLAVFSIADLHFGKLSHGAETGDNFDHKIASATFMHILNKAIADMKMQIKMGKKLERIIFYWSQDFFHYDNMEGTTTAGTKQDCDIRLPKMYKLGCHLLVTAIRELAKIAPVETFWVRSNHDTVLGYCAMMHLAGVFGSNPNVIIDDSEFPRKYRRYGVTELGFAHGDKEGKRIADCMQNDEEGKKYWSECTYHEFFLGHYHSESSRDISGVLCRYLGSPTSADYWTNTSGFVGAQKKSQVFYYNKEEGLSGYCCIMIPRSISLEE